MALLSGSPELAVAHLAACGGSEAPGRHLADAVHLGLALHWMGALRSVPAAAAAGAAGEAAAAGAPPPRLAGMPPPGWALAPAAPEDCGGLLLQMTPPQGEEG